MSGPSNLVELETLFIEKLQEKYKLNKRDLKKAFSRFDLDNNGLLDLNELSKGIQLFLNGVKESQVNELVACYDQNGDGKLSYEEFLHFLTTRSAIIPDDSYSETTSSREGPTGGSVRGGRSNDVQHYDNGSPMGNDCGNYNNDDDDSYDQDYSPQKPQKQQQQQQRGGGGGGVQQIDRQMNRMSVRDCASDGYDDRQEIANRANTNLQQRGGGRRQGQQPQQPQYNNYVGGGGHGGGDGYDDNSTVYSSTASSRPDSALDPTNPKELEYRAKVYIQNLKSFLLRKVADLRMTGKVKISATMKGSELQESVARELLAKVFQPYCGQGEGRARESYTGIEYPDFARVLRSFVFPGTSQIRNEVIQFLFNLCNVKDDGSVFLNEENRDVANHNILVDMIFGPPTTQKDRKDRGLIRVGKSSEESSMANEQDFGSGMQLKGYVEKFQSGRDVVVSGPVKLSSATDAKVEKAMDSLAVPLRFISRKSRTALSVPSSFDPVVSIKKSNSLPSYDLVRKHVFGLSTSTYSGNTLFVLPSTPSAFASRDRAQQQQHQKSHHRGASGGGGAGGQRERVTEREYNQRNSPSFIDHATVVYASAGLGVVHNLADNSQLFFDNHADDITCITVSADGQYAATGCMGKAAVVHVWETNIPLSDAKKSIATLGKGFFIRGVCSVEFSYDNVYLLCVGCDDQHMLGIFHIASGTRILEQSTQNGIPPMIKFMNYCPAPQYTEFISREHAGLCDIFATAGDHHIRLWSFKRPNSPGDTTIGSSSLTYKGMTIGKAATTAAKVYTCCGFIFCEDKTYDFVCGGSNGVVYLYRRGVLTAFGQILRGKVQCLVVAGDRVIVGGAGGKLKILDGRTLSTIQDYSLLGPLSSPTTKTLVSGRPGSAIVPTSRAKSAPRGGGRPLSAGRPASGGEIVTAKAALKAPTHAAGGGGARPVGGNIISTANDPIVEVEQMSGAKTVTGIAVVRGSGRSASQGMYLIVSLGTGKVVRVDVGSAGPVTPRPGSASYAQQAATPVYYGKDLFHFHTGPVYGLAADVTSGRRLIATVDDHRKLMVWDAQNCFLLAKAVTTNPSRCCHIDKTNRFIAVGSTAGSVTIHFLSSALDSTGNYFRIEEVAYRKDAKAEATEIKFSPSNTMLALGSRDDFIYLYAVECDIQTVGNGRNTVENASCVIRAMHKLKGHSATITHIDWSVDSLLLQSTCGAYELLCWDVESGRLNSSVNVADIKWKTRHCVLGFAVMGIWPMYADGTDINSVDVSTEKGIVVTANDAGGLVKLFNYPCVVKNAPGKEYTGHSSHVTNVKFMSGGDTVISTGGNDGSVVVWDVVYDTTVDDTDKFR